MDGGTSRNEGVHIVARVTGPAVPLSAVQSAEPAPTSRGVNEGVRIIADFRDTARPLNVPGPVETVLPITTSPETFSTGTLAVHTAEGVDLSPGRSSVSPVENSRDQLAAIVRQMETALQTMQRALAQVKELRDKAG